MEHSHNRISLSYWPYTCAVVFCLFMGSAVVALAQPTGGEALALALRANVVSLVVERQDGTHNGFGFIVAERGGQVWMVTANHVVRSGLPDEATRIAVRYFQAQGTSYPATLLETSDRTYDIAVLQAQAPAGLTWQQAAVGTQRAARGTSVWFIGRSGAWYVPTIPGRINTLALDLRYLIDNLPVRVGTSGAPLIADTGIIGMLITDASESTEAVSIEVIARAFAQWNLPWHLTAMQDGVTRDPTPTTSDQPGASEVGTLCPTLSNGETGILLTVSSHGHEHQVYSGSCIDLAPGTYHLTEDDPNIFCLPYQIKVAAGKTNDFQLSCR